MIRSVRITGGTIRGRQIRVPKGDHVRPTTDRVREALFSILAARLDGAAFLDLYAGSGAVGLDAWSRGARPVWWVEHHPSGFAVLQRNVETLCDDGVCVVRADAVKFLKKGLVPRRFDIIFADPPYWESGGREFREDRLHPQDGRGMPDVLLRAAAATEVLASDGLFIVEQGTKTPYRPVDGWEMVQERVYGMSCLRMFRQAVRAT